MNSTPTAASNPITPFWENIPQIFKYPAHPSALTTIALFSVLWLSALLPGLIGFVCWLIMAAATYKFAYSVLVHTARGRMEPPEGYFSDVSEGVYWQQIGMWLLMFLAVWLIAAFISIALALLVGLFILLALPIATMALAIDQSVLHALNPAVWVEGMRRIGWPYLVVVVFLLLLIISSWTVRAFVAPVLPFLLGYMAFHFISIYFLVAMFFLMGYVIYQYHEELGFEVDEFAAGGLAEDVARDPVIARAEQLLEDGQPEEAKRVLADAASDAGALSEAAAMYQRLCKVTGDHAGLAEFGRRQISALLELGKHREAVDLVRECLQADPAFRPARPEQVAPLAEMAERFGYFQLALKITSGFGKRHPDHPDTPRVYLLAARILTDKLGRDDQAHKILLQLERKYPDHELAPEISKLRGVLDAVRGSGNSSNGG